MKTILFVDGMNLLGKLEQVFEVERQPVPSWHTYDFRGLFNHALEGIAVDEQRIYFAKLHQHPDTLGKSQALIKERRLLKRHFEDLGFTYIVAGNVRANIGKDIRGKETLIFREKGVDTRIVVDMMVAACDKQIGTAVIASSDSDLQPAIQELRKRGIRQIYLGFQIEPNKGLSYTTDSTILIRNAEALKFHRVLKLAA